MTDTDTLQISLAQIAPVWLDRAATVARVAESVVEAGRTGSRLVVFGEALVPGYPFWVERTDGARFDSAVQRDLYAHYQDQAVDLDAGHLEPVVTAAARHGIAVAVGIIERPRDRGGHSLYCSLVYVDAGGEIRSVHRKLVPTYEERLVWSPGDGHGLQTHALGRFRVGGLNCWENWLPLVRAALYAQGEDLHLSVWPGGEHLTRDITRFIAAESRSYVAAAGGVMHADMIGDHVPHRELILADDRGWYARGGSCLVAPDGSWVIEPVDAREELVTALIDHREVRRARQHLDPVGHYSRPDVTRLVLDRRRQSTLEEA
ncbi:carbon-nitrogen hydrolase family protein [bacterium]|nr:carbon-nitrogen hydrolase family protein [bacterium]